MLSVEEKTLISRAFLENRMACMPIDIQGHYLLESDHPRVFSDFCERALDRTTLFVENLRAYTNVMRVIWILFSGKDERPYQNIDQPNENIFFKHRMSAFSDLVHEKIKRDDKVLVQEFDLKEYLFENNIDTIVVTGVTADGCVSETVKDAIERGLEVIVLLDAIDFMDIGQITDEDNLNVVHARSVFGPNAILTTTDELTALLESTLSPQTSLTQHVQSTRNGHLTGGRALKVK